MKIPSLYFLKEWSADRDRIRWRCFIKSEIYFGSDRETDIKIDGQGLRARLNFRDKEFEDFESRSLRSLEETELLVLNSKVFSWRRFRLKNSILLWALFSMVVVALSGFAIRSAGCHSRNLDDQERKSAASILELLKSKDFIQARAKLNEMTLSFGGESCLPDEVRDLELALAEALLIQKLERKDYLKAANYLARVELRLRAEDAQSLREQILSGARHLFWRSWSLERKDPGESYRLQREAQQICQQFRLKSGCFLSGEK
ncbi:MAG: hypothetical protein ACO3LE_02020 [Bdellovibrionota bacterium]